MTLNGNDANVKVAIAADDDSFGGGWRQYCLTAGVPFVDVSLFDSNLISRVNGCTHLLSRPSLTDPKTSVFAKSILRSLDETGIKVFPTYRSIWHYDDKVAQKYLLEAIGAPLARSEVFFSLLDVHKWAEHADFPVVFKLRGGAGSGNVSLLRNKAEALVQAKRMFGKGEISSPSYFSDFSRKLRNTRSAVKFRQKLLRMPTYFKRANRLRAETARERGYFYVQEFLPNNKYDTRVVTLGHRVLGFRRFNRHNDFRASGSGNIDFDADKIDSRMIEIARKVSNRLGFETMAYDFVLDRNQNPKIVEISYTYIEHPVTLCPGYWTGDGSFMTGSIRPSICIIEDLLQEPRSKSGAD